MKQKINLARISRYVLLLGLIACACFAAARAQVPNGTVIPRVCVDNRLQTGTVTLANAVPAGVAEIVISAPLEGTMRLVINPGAATEERIFARTRSGDDPTGLTRQLVNAHAAGETIQWSDDAEAFFGYNNTSSSTVSISRGIITNNFFAPGALGYPAQPDSFLPGIQENVFSIKLVSGPQYTWFLNNSSASFGANPGQGCGTITYQGRLSDGNAAANGQSVPFAINAQNASNAANATNAATAANATNATNAEQLGGVAASQYVTMTSASGSFIQNTTTTQSNSNFNISGNGIIGGKADIGGSLTVAGALNANSLSGNGAGLTGIFDIFSLNKLISDAIPANTSGYSFIGETQSVTLTGGRRITGSASVPLATSSGTSVVSVGLCYKIGDGAITNFAGSHSTNAIVDPTFKIYAASATVVPGAGLVQFGMCIGNFNQSVTINSVNGWAMLTNN